MVEEIPVYRLTKSEVDALLEILMNQYIDYEKVLAHEVITRLYKWSNNDELHKRGIEKS